MFFLLFFVLTFLLLFSHPSMYIYQIILYVFYELFYHLVDFLVTFLKMISFVLSFLFIIYFISFFYRIYLDNEFLTLMAKDQKILSEEKVLWLTQRCCCRSPSKLDLCNHVDEHLYNHSHSLLQIYLLNQQDQFQGSNND